MSTTKVHVCLLLSLWAAFSLPQSVAEEVIPKVGALTRLAPVVSSTKMPHRSLKLVSRVALSPHYQIELLVAYRPPDFFLLRISDGRDGTPIVYLCNDQLIMYNAADGDVLYFSAAKFDYTIGLKNGDFHHGLILSPTRGRSTISVDVQSMYARAGGRDAVTTSGRGTFRLARSWVNDAFLIATIDPSRRCPFTRIDLYDVDSMLPDLSIRGLSVDEDFGKCWPDFPPIRQFIGKVTLTDLTGKGPDSKLSPDVPVLMEKCFIARQAIYNEEIRQLYKDSFGDKVDWKQAESSDLRLSRSLCQILGTPAIVP